MKNYIKMLAITSLIVGSCSYSDDSDYTYVTQNIIIPTGSGENDIVDEIKRYSNLSKADEDKWKFFKLILGEYDVVPALAMGGYSTFKVGEYVFKNFNDINKLNVLSTIKEYTPPKVMEYLPTLPDITLSDTLKKGLLVTGGAALAGFVSYNVLYPRMYRGILNKIQNFIDVCSGLEIAVNNYGNFPLEWNNFSNIAKCNALHNLREQAGHATALLNYIRSNTEEITMMRKMIDSYTINLDNSLLRYSCGDIFTYQQNKAQRDLAYRANWWSMMRDIFKLGKEVVTTGKDVVGWTIENKGSIASFLGAGWLAKWYLGK